MNASNQPAKVKPEFDGGRDARPTVIPAPRRDGMFTGWGVRF